MIVVVFGLPGSGKSYFARHLAERLGGAYLNTDIIRRQLTETPGYTPEEKRKVYRELIHQMLMAARGHAYTIVDGTFYQAALRELVADKARMGGFKMVFIEITADEEIIRERTARERENSDADFAVYRLIKTSFDPFRGDHLKLRSSNDNLEEMIETAIKYLKTQARD